MANSPSKCGINSDDKKLSSNNVWLQDEFEFGRPKTLKEKRTPHFSFLPNARPLPFVTEFEPRRKLLDSVIFTLAHLGDVNLLSAARLIEIGMFILHVCNNQEMHHTACHMMSSLNGHILLMTTRAAAFCEISLAMSRGVDFLTLK